MNAVEMILTRMRQKATLLALYWQGQTIDYNTFCDLIDNWYNRLVTMEIRAGVVCGVLGDYSPQCCALMVALMRANAILVPFTWNIEHEMPPLLELAGVQYLFRFDHADGWRVETFENVAQNQLVLSFSTRETPGLIVFTSGSTGRPKGILHDCERVLRKFEIERKAWRTILFLMMDHFGGFNTLLSVFAYGGMGVCLPNRTPDTVCRLIEQSQANLLPTTPTFLNFLLASGSYQDFNLSSVELITYGTEVMPETTLKRIKTAFPQAELKQTYGLSELGVLRSKSQDAQSPWVKIGGDGFEIKIVDNVLWVRSEANMVGYLNAPSPFDAEGWMCTGDEVEVNGEYIRILGRKSEMINVGGQKVFPLEVETVLLEADNIREATVYGVPHPLMGQVVQAGVSLHTPEDAIALSERLRKFCLERLARYKVPVRFVVVSQDEQHSDRFKKIRKIG